MSEAEKWTEVIQKFKESGKSQRVFSVENGIKRSSLRYWIDRLEQLEIGDEISFAEIIVGEIC